MSDIVEQSCNDMSSPSSEREELEKQVFDLQTQLSEARRKLEDLSAGGDRQNEQEFPTAQIAQPDKSTSSSDPKLHTLLLLADSALPLGSFAFSSGLESCLAHNKISRAGESPRSIFQKFLLQSLHSLTSTALPYLLAAHREPARLIDLDNDFDASTPCGVARRASIAQGKAFLAVWERSFKLHYQHAENQVISELGRFAEALRTGSGEEYPVAAHLAPLWGAITLVLGLSLHSSAYMFLFSHARTLVSSAVRASVLGPYQAQVILADSNLNRVIETLIERHWKVEPENAGQTVPAMDIWMGRHELLYSRIFNS